MGVLGNAQFLVMFPQQKCDIEIFYLKLTNQYLLIICNIYLNLRYHPRPHNAHVRVGNNN